jgi:hypothetical protein
VRQKCNHGSFELLEDRRLMSVTATPAYLVPTAPGVEITPVLTAGDTVGDYRMVGIPDGLGVFDNGDGTFTVLMNHELRPTQGTVRSHGSTGAFVSKWVIDKTTLNVLSGDDLIKQVYLFNTTTRQYEPAVAAFNRFCSATLAEPTAFFNPRTGRGTHELIFTNGEEAADGRAFAHVVSTGQTYEFAGMGNLAFENVVPNPFPQDLTVVGAEDDGNRLFTSEGAGITIDPKTGLPIEVPSEVYFYVGQKKSAGSVLDRAGLTGGVLAGLKVGSAADETAVHSGDRFSLAGFGDVSTWDDKQLQRRRSPTASPSSAGRKTARGTRAIPTSTASSPPTSSPATPACGSSPSTTSANPRPAARSRSSTTRPRPRRAKCSTTSR